MICNKCNASIPDDSKFCFLCGSKQDDLAEQPEPQSRSYFQKAGDLSRTRLEEEEYPAYRTSGNQQDSIYSHKAEPKQKTTPNYISLALAIAGLVVLFFVPFIAINRNSIDDPLNGYQILFMTGFYLGLLFSSPAHQAMVVSMLGLLGSLISILCKSRVLSRITAACTAFLLIIIGIIQYQSLFDFELFAIFDYKPLDIFGVGYFGLLIILMAIAVLGGRSEI